jgi:hypothetical protein
VCRTLTADLTLRGFAVAKAEKREAKLRDFLAKLDAGQNVQNRDLRTWLGADAYADYEHDCKSQKEFRTELKNKPIAVQEYEQRLKRALFAYNKGEGASVRGKHTAAKPSFAKADSLFESALEYLQEIVAADPSLCVWFDRDTSWTIDGEASIDAISIPRVVTSRSLDSRGGGFIGQLRSKRDLKIAAVERALLVADDDDEQETVEQAAKQKAQLDKLLRLHDSDL